MPNKKMKRTQKAAPLILIVRRKNDYLRDTHRLIIELISLGE